MSLELLVFIIEYGVQSIATLVRVAGCCRVFQSAHGCAGCYKCCSLLWGAADCCKVLKSPVGYCEMVQSDAMCLNVTQ